MKRTSFLGISSKRSCRSSKNHSTSATRSDRVPDELWTDVHDIAQETGSKIILKKKKCKAVKLLSVEALQIAVKRREVNSTGEEERYIHLNAKFQRIARRDQKAFLGDQHKRNKRKQ